MGRTIVAGLGVVALSLGGCGGAGDPEEAKSAAKQYIRALGARDFSAACKVASRRLVVSGQFGEMYPAWASGCETLLRRHAGVNDPGLKSAQARSVEIRGREAKVEVTGTDTAGSKTTVAVNLRKESGRWRVVYASSTG